ncbi:phosphoglycolate phosphatase [Natronomonas pharaonis DSM 2160]|uniref:Phosphoglycolate phosphatase n=1 Tax=Natronomonas pharaonis (strain ATCC 35678 / DSM 2160 / CIP 103997 / JCM 8858 / NBRC 14720 / NCIMB 2260 / Gabara) TaxID=348780 RepID=PGP_NATPD|nr:phosphoglycolate phosphatase [Natronomonas pharaonis]Q3ISC7.1 RecName: Full=Phosphoglycolate phosphatase; Short=PGP; Short=PGPase [Natronomonas pharaonis DSM 2160]CAI48960.1 phosphoglycolate phosphatase [Natronomonas pharaonis DSM 2160]
MVAPLAVDIDGTLTRPDKSIDPRVFDAIRAWDDHVVIATGKSFPYPVGLCEFLGMPLNVIAENGGAVYVEPAGEVVYNGDPEGAAAVAEEYVAAGYDLGWGAVDMVNRWRETELAVDRDQPLEPLVAIADDHGMDVVDTGYAYHVKDAGVDKATGLETVAELLGVVPSSFIAIGDSENDAELLELAGTGFAVANADAHARGAADAVTDASFADGFLEALDRARDNR